MLLSSDGIEGPGNYGLNKDCLLTILTAKDNKVTANFALIQPGIADAKEVVAALSSLIGLDAPPSVESLTSMMRMANGRNKRKGENARVRKRGQNMEKENAHNEGRKLPDAAPTDSQLVGYLRQFIQKSNSNEQVDKVLNQVRSYIKGNENLIKQAVNGWTRVLHVKYGTDLFTVAYHPSGNWLASGGEDGTVRFIDAQTDKILQEKKAHDDWIYALAFSPDGTFMASGDWSGKVVFSGSIKRAPIKKGCFTEHKHVYPATSFCSPPRRIMSSDS